MAWTLHPSSASVELGLGFGAAQLGNLFRSISECESWAVQQAAWDAGMRVFDTSPFYGFGLSELRLGAFLRSRPAGSYRMITKVGRSMAPASERSGATPFADPLPFDAVVDFGYDATMRSLEQSMMRLGVSRFDVLLVHDLDRRNLGEAFEKHYADARVGAFRALDQLRAAGQVDAIGVAVNEADVGTRMLQDADFDVVLLAGRYTLLEQTALQSFLPLVQRQGLALLLGGVFNTGILASGARDGATYNYAPAAPEMLSRAGAIEALCREFGVPLAAASLQFAMAHPAVACTLIGTSRPERITEQCHLAQLAIPQPFWQALRRRGLVDSAAPLPQA